MDGEDHTHCTLKTSVEFENSRHAVACYKRLNLSYLPKSPYISSSRHSHCTGWPIPSSFQSNFYILLNLFSSWIYNKVAEIQLGDFKQWSINQLLLRFNYNDLLLSTGLGQNYVTTIHCPVVFHGLEKFSFWSSVF